MKKNATKKLFSFPEVTFFQMDPLFFHRTDQSARLKFYVVYLLVFLFVFMTVATGCLASPFYPS